MSEEKAVDPVLEHLKGISDQLDRMDDKLDAVTRRAVIAGAASGAIAGSIVPPLIQAGIELIKMKLGG